MARDRVILTIFHSFAAFDVSNSICSKAIAHRINGCNAIFYANDSFYPLTATEMNEFCERRREIDEKREKQREDKKSDAMSMNSFN